jgi:hypothetical protein
VRPGVEWDLANIVQKKGESLWKFIQRFYNKRNIILEKHHPVIPDASDPPMVGYLLELFWQLPLVGPTMLMRQASMSVF